MPLIIIFDLTLDRRVFLRFHSWDFHWLYFPIQKCRLKTLPFRAEGSERTLSSAALRCPNFTRKCCTWLSWWSVYRKWSERVGPVYSWDGSSGRLRPRVAGSHCSSGRSCSYCGKARSRGRKSIVLNIGTFTFKTLLYLLLTNLVKLHLRFLCMVFLFDGLQLTHVF